MTEKEKTKKEKKRKRPHLWSRIIASILIFSVLVGVAGLSFAYLYTNGLLNEVTVDADRFNNIESTIVYADDGVTEIATLGLKSRENISYEVLPQSLVDAFVAIEDSRFFEHDGFDVPRFTKAALENLIDTFKYRTLVFGQGGSTFTMQLVKNTLFVYDDGDITSEADSSGQSGINRKLKEIYIARYIENNNILNKKEILSLYLNLINFGAGNNILGVQNSAKAYFNKDVSSLNLIESAFLAGVINAPNANSPYNSIRNATERTHDVLYQMKNHGYISQDEYDLAIAVPIENLFAKQEYDAADYPFQAYVDAVVDEVAELLKENYPDEQLDPYRVPMRIYTGMNVSVQANIDKVQNREIAYLDQGADSYIQFSSAIVQNTTGIVVGLAGGYDYYGERLLNRATSAEISPGSTIKPLLDYALAFEYAGLSTSHVFLDAPFSWSGGIPVYNYDSRFLGEIPLTQAVGDSRNIPAIKALQMALNASSYDTAIEYLRNLGFNDNVADNFNLQYAIGGDKFEATTLQLASAYAAMYNSGTYIKPHTVTRIEFLDTREAINPHYEPVQVLSPESSYLVTRIMRFAVEGPYSYVIRPMRKSYPVYGKTGTHAWGSEAPNFGAPVGATKDRVMIGGTSEYSIATWTGFDIADPAKKPWFSSEEVDFNLTGRFNGFMLDILAEEFGTPSDVSRPSGVSDITHILGTFPYQAPLADMNQDLVVTGQIRSKFAELATPAPQPLDALQSQSVSSSLQGNNIVFNVDVSPYPDPERLKVAPNTLEMEGNRTGQRLFDPSWIFGAVRYKTEVRVGGNVVEEIVTDNHSHQISVRLDTSVTKYQICSFYTYDKSRTQRSEGKCTDYDASQLGITVPDFTNQSYDSFLTWINKNGFPQPNISWDASSSLSNFRRIRSIDPNLANKTVSIGSIPTLTFNVVVNDYSVSVSTYSTVTALKNFLRNYDVSVNNPNGKENIVAFQTSGGSASSFSLNAYVGSTITVITE